MARNYQELKVWQKAIELNVAIYKCTESFPKSEVYGLTSQIRRSAVSIASNIAEGSERNSDRDFARFLNMAMGSLAECETQCVIAMKLGFLSENDYSHLLSMTAELGKMLNGLLKKLETGDRRLEIVHA
jgi:four helix bundle protein